MLMVLVSLKVSVIFETFQCFHSAYVIYIIGSTDTRLTVEIEFYSSVSKISMFSVNIVSGANDEHNFCQNQLKGSLSQINLSKVVKLFTSALFFHTLHIVVLGHLLSSPFTLNRPSLTSRLKIANRSHYHSAPVLWNNLPNDHVAHHVTPSPVLNSPVSDLSTSLS